jgi:L-threonylcarbamoyladenylate synthase
METIRQSKKALGKAVLLIKKGRVIICPTDTVYGFLADAASKKAVGDIFKIKKRPTSKPLPVFIKDIKTAKKLAFIKKEEEKILKKYWPGKYTFVLKRKKGVKLYGVDENTIALRIPKYKFLNDLLKKINKPLVQTSVNVSGKQPLTKIKDIQETIEGMDFEILIINGGDLKRVKPSKIIDLTSKALTIIR